MITEIYKNVYVYIYIYIYIYIYMYINLSKIGGYYEKSVWNKSDKIKRQCGKIHTFYNTWKFT